MPAVCRFITTAPGLSATHVAFMRDRWNMEIADFMERLISHEPVSA
jgi:hypothetical protein